jgi:hypothetical protein
MASLHRSWRCMAGDGSPAPDTVFIAADDTKAVHGCWPSVLGAGRELMAG